MILTPTQERAIRTGQVNCEKVRQKLEFYEAMAQHDPTFGPRAIALREAFDHQCQLQAAALALNDASK